MALQDILGQIGDMAGDAVEGAQDALGNVTEGVDLGGIVEGAQDAIGGIAENVDLGNIAEAAGGVLEGIFGGDKE